MSEAIWAQWYDIAEDRRADYYDWLHAGYLPRLLAKPGFAWAAHYRITQRRRPHGRYRYDPRPARS